MDVLLINMPYHDIRWPSIALGLLKAALVKHGISCRVIYGNLRYANLMGVRTFLAGRDGWNSTYLGDWLFQRALFPAHAVAPETYFSGVSEGRTADGKASEWSCSRLLDLRERSEAFLRNLVENVIGQRPAAVGCTLTVTQLFSSLALLKQIKEKSPGIATMVGGPACEAGMGKALHQAFPFIDFVVSGDADEVIVPLAHGILRNGLGLVDETLPEGVLGPVFREQSYPEGEGPHHGTRAKIHSLDGLPPPDYDDYFETLSDSASLREHIQPAILFETSRGCWWGEKVLCKFCGDCGAFPEYRTKSAVRALDEVTYLHRRHRIKRFVATDNAMNREYFENFLPRLGEITNGLSLFFEVRADLSKDQARRLRRAGVTYVQAGIESLNTDALKELDKGVAAWQNIQCLKWCRQFGIALSWFFMTRIPKEKDRWHREEADLIPLITHLQPPNFVGYVRPDRYSRYFREAEQYGLHIRTKERYLRLFPLPREVVSNFAFHLEETGTKAQLQDELDFVLRPGIFELKKAVKKWREEFKRSREPARLEMTRQGDMLVIADTRKIAVSGMHLLEGLNRQILLACDQAPLKNRLLRDFERKGFDHSEIEESIQNLVHNKLVMALDNRMISLVLEAPCLPYVSWEEQAIGWVEGEDH